MVVKGSFRKPTGPLYTKYFAALRLLVMIYMKKVKFVWEESILSG